MGESLVATSHVEDKMGETANSIPALEVSVSFGRFENDSLSWEKWSSFSQNKYLEEVEKCATPGSVAKKKAYFEAHYKKIAARKAELLDQKPMEHDSLRTGACGNEDLTGNGNSNASGADSEFTISNSQNSAEGVVQEPELDVELGNGHFDESNEDSPVYVDEQGPSGVQDLLVRTVREELDKRLDSPALEEIQEVALVEEEEAASTGTQDRKELPTNLKKEMETIPPARQKNVKPDNHKKPQKTTPTSRLTDVTRVKKKPSPPVTKSPQISTPKVSKPLSTSTSMSASHSSSTRKIISSTLPKTKVPSRLDNKKAAPKALHMSLSMDSPTSTKKSMDSPNNPPSLTTARKSFIMEKMGDKDIVKRAFKTFQNNFEQLKSSVEQRSLGAKQVPSKGADAKVSTASTARRENTGTLRAGSMDKKTAKAAPSSFGLKSEQKAEKKNEFLKKSIDKSSAKQVGNAHLQTKSKEKEAEIWKIRRQRQSPNLKATPLPSFYHGQKVSKSPLDKEGSKTLRV